jgi:hypothetical protein
MLVAFAVTGMLVSVLMSSLFYIFRVQESVRDEVVVREQELRGRAWFREILSNCLPADDKTPLAFTGSPEEIRCESTGAIVPSPLPVITVITLSLAEQERGGVALRYREGDTGEDVDLARWETRDVEFRFIDSDGQEQDHWPPGKTPYEALPRQIRLLFDDRGGNRSAAMEIPWQVAVRADPWRPEKPVLPPL